MLLAALAVGAFFQTNNARLVAITCFVFSAIVHDAITQHPIFNNGFYYVSAGAFNLLAVFILHKINHVARLIIDLQIICGVAFFLNVYGFVIYMAYLPTDSYQQMFPAVYWLALIALLKKDDSNVGYAGGTGILGGILKFLLPRLERLQLHLRNGEKA